MAANEMNEMRPLILAAALALAGAVALVSLLSAVADAARMRPARHVPALAFAFLPPAAFALQEVLELSLHTGHFGWRAVLAPGQRFEYTSGVPLPTASGFMTGRYQMVTEAGERFEVDIPTFSLDCPHHKRVLN